VALADGAGAVATEYRYEPFGTATASGTGSANEFGYTGREADGTGVYYYRARYYHPGLQRFISEDPIGFAGGDPNLYSYVFNAPTGLRDPLGLAVDPISLTAFAIFCGSGAAINVTTQFVLSGRKPSLGEAAHAAAVGCGIGVLTLTAGIAAGAVAAGGFLAGDVATTAAAARGLDVILKSDPKTFHRFLRSLQGDASRAKGATRTAEETRKILDEALRRGYTMRGGVDSNWVGGPHVNLVPTVGPDVHFPVPPGFIP
jgi:RHS repeat-associated protein